MITCGELLAKMLAAYGIDTVFGIPGTHTIELYRGLPQTAMRHITPRHEQGAGFMADGYARVTGRPAACFTVSGPGALNIGTAMGQALLDSVPMLVISADNATYERGLGEGRLHESSDLAQSMALCSRWSHYLARPDELPRVLARAFAIFASERPGPVHITVPQDVITAAADHVQPQVWPMPSRPAADPAALAEMARLLDGAKRPVIAAGGGAADAAELLRALAEQLDAPVTLTHNAKGVLPRDHPLYVAGSPSFEPVRALYREADVILGVGTEFAETDYDFFFDGQFDLGPGKLLRIDIDAAQLSRHSVPAVAVCADAALALRSLRDLCGNASRSGAERTAAVNHALAALDDANYQSFLDAIEQALPGAAVLGDSTQPAYYAAAQFHPSGPRSFASAATGYGTLGYALPAACGAKLGQPQRPIVCLIGDGGLQFTIAELAAAVEAQLDVAIVVWNNHGYDMIAQNFRSAGMAPIACDIYTPDILAIAAGYGCHTERATSIDEFKEALRASQGRGVPSVIEVLEDDFIA
jgi:acetolactate synthase-1/2/3 large subunit